MRSTFSITFFVKKSVVYKDATSPVMGRIRVNGAVSDFHTKLCLLPGQWNQQKCRGKGKSPHILKLNLTLNAIENQINELKTSLLQTQGYVTSLTLKEAYLNQSQTAEEKAGEQKRLEQAEAERQAKERKEREEQERKERGVLLIEYFNQYIESRRDEVTAGQLTGKTFSRYENVRTRLIAYMKSKYKCSDIPMKQIDLFFIKNFEMYLRTHFKCGNNTIMKIVQKLGTVVTLAHDTGLLPTNPFRLYHFHFEETERDILTLDELDNLYNYQFTCSKLEQVRDTYIFSCYTDLLQ